MISDQPSSKPDLYVIARIISELKVNGSMRRTELATSIGVAYDRSSKYLDWMCNKGLLSVDGDGNVRLTQLGIDTYDNLVKWILNYVGKLRFPRL